MTVPQGGVGTLPSIITPLYNYSGTITATCSGLPSNSICRFFPTSVALSGGAQSFTVYVYTNTNPNIATMETPEIRGQNRGIYAAGMIPLAALALVWLRRRKALATKMRLLSSLLIVLLAASGMTAISGCGKTAPSVSSNTGYTTPTGATNSSVIFTDGSGNTHTVNLVITINAPYSLP